MLLLLLVYLWGVGHVVARLHLQGREMRKRDLALVTLGCLGWMCLPIVWAHVMRRGI